MADMARMKPAPGDRQACNLSRVKQVRQWIGLRGRIREEAVLDD